MSPSSFHTSTKLKSAGVLDATDFEASESGPSSVGPFSTPISSWSNQLVATSNHDLTQSWYNETDAISHHAEESQLQSTPNIASDGLAAHETRTVAWLDLFPLEYIRQPTPKSLIPCFCEDPCSIEKAKLKTKRALQQEQPYVLLPALLKALQDPTFVPSLPATTFHEIIRFLDPKHFLQPFKRIHNELHPAQIAIFGDGEPQIQEIFNDYEKIVNAILQSRVIGGRKLGIEEYRLLLNALSHAGHGRAAWRAWRAMKEAGIEPDLDCYNFYFEARCWSNAYHPGERFKLRVIPMTMKFRQAPLLGKDSRRLPGYSVGPGGLKTTISKTFVDMIEQGIVADSRAFSLLMTALAKEGDLVGVKSILKQVWDVDADSPAEVNEDPQRPNGLARESPLFRDDEVLWTIVNIFGSNSDIPAALRVVENVSRRYSISISSRIWGVLLDWTFVLSKRCSLKTKSEHDWTGLALGQLPPRSVESLWNTMISEPYNIKPTMAMYDRYVRNLYVRDMLALFLAQASRGLILYWSLFERYARLTVQLSNRKSWAKDTDSMNDAIHDLNQQPPYVVSSHRSDRQDQYPARLRYQEGVLRLELIRHFATISRWFLLLLRGTRWLDQYNRIFLWERQRLPTVIYKLWLFRPRRYIGYEMNTGHVEIVVPQEGRNRSKTGIFNARMRQHLHSRRGKIMRQLRQDKNALRHSYDHSTRGPSVLRPTKPRRSVFKSRPGEARKTKVSQALIAKRSGQKQRNIAGVLKG